MWPNRYSCYFENVASFQTNYLVFNLSEPFLNFSESFVALRRCKMEVDSNITSNARLIWERVDFHRECDLVMSPLSQESCFDFMTTSKKRLVHNVVAPGPVVKRQLGPHHGLVFHNFSPAVTIEQRPPRRLEECYP